MPPSRLANLLRWWVGRVQRRPVLVLVAGLLIALALSTVAFQRLGVDTNTEDMLSEHLEWRQHFARFKDNFPHFNEAIVVVVDAPVPESAEGAAGALAAALEAEPELFRRVEWLAGSEFFRRHGLLYLDPAELEDFGDRLARAQPLLARLAAAPHIEGLASVLEEALQAGPERAGLEAAIEEFLGGLEPAFRAAAAGRHAPVSWRLAPEDTGPGTGSLQVISVDPRMDFAELMPGRRPIERIRELAAAVAAGAGEGVEIRLTGPTPLMHEELESVGRGAAWGVGSALVLVALVLYWALKSWRLIAATLVTLLAGLGSTAGFAALAVGQLNLISVAFAVLYIGLGVDFAIHYCLRFRELRLAGAGADEAINRTAGDVGVSLVLCAVTTSLGFFAFLPTDFKGVAELGLISGVGMYISLLASLTLLPAMLALLAPRPFAAGRPMPARWRAFPQRHFAAVIAAFAVLAAGAAALVPGLRFDSDTMNLRDRESESVATFYELLERSPDPPLAVSVLAESAHAAEALGARLAALEVVERSRWLGDFVPAEQTARLEAIEEIGWLVGPVPEIRTDAEPEDPAGAVERLEAALETSGLAAAEALLEAVGVFRAALETAGPEAADGLLARLDRNLFGHFPAALERLEQALQAAPFGREDLPGALRENWVGREGLYRVSAYPAFDTTEPGRLGAFVGAVRAEAPAATGLPVVNYRAGLSVQAAFREAFVLAAVAIAALLALLLRSLVHTLIVLLPIAAAALLTAGAAAAFGLPLTFANVIALPLLLGVGVDSGIHMIWRMRAAPPRSAAALGSSTARGVFFSALTTTVSFGNLAFSAHPGTASMGMLLVMGMILMTVSTLILLPALMAALASWRLKRAAP